jgi:branched-chain amino acid transport system substrate-binding protein
MSIARTASAPGPIMGRSGDRAGFPLKGRRVLAEVGGIRHFAWCRAGRHIVIDSGGAPGTKFIHPLKNCAFGTASCREPGQWEISEAEARFQESGAGAVGARATVPAKNWEDDMKRLCMIAAGAALVAAPAFAADDTITIGMTVSRTGSLNVDSVAELKGSELWRDEVNAAGGIKVGNKHYMIRFVEYDDQSQGGRVQQLYTRLIVQDHAQYLFSPYSSGLSATAAVITEQYGKIMLVGGGAEGKIFQLGNKYLFQCITSADHYLTGAIQVLKEKTPGAKIAFVYSDDPFSKAVVTAARTQAAATGFKEVLVESYPASTTDFSPIINKIISSKADVFMGGGHYPDGATLARQLYDQKANLKSVTILVAPDSPKFASLGPAAVGITVPSQWEPAVTYKPDFGPTPKEFAKAYEAKFNTGVDYHAASGYIEGLLLQHAMEKAGSIEPDKVAAELTKLEVTTFFGKYKVASDANNHGLQIAHDMVLAQWQMKDGKLSLEMVWPDAAKTANLIFATQ